MLRVFVLDYESRAFKYLGDWETSFVFGVVIPILNLRDERYVIIPENTVDIVTIIEEDCHEEKR